MATRGTMTIETNIEVFYFCRTPMCSYGSKRKEKYMKSKSEIPLGGTPCSLSSLLSEVAGLLDPLLHKKGVGRAEFSHEYGILRLKFGHCQVGVAVGSDDEGPPYLYAITVDEGLLSRERPLVHCDMLGRTSVDGETRLPVQGE